MTAEAAAPSAPPAGKPRRLLWLWIGAFGFLGLVGAFCWLVLGPYLQVRKAIVRTMYFEPPGVAIERLGGPRAAARKLSLYTRLPDRFAADKPSAAYLMGFCDSEAVPRLVVLLKSEDRGMRREVASALGSAHDRRAVGSLAAALQDPDRNVRFNAIKALRAIGGREAVAALIEALGNPDIETSYCASMQLGTAAAGDTEIVAALLAALKSHPNVTVRAHAAMALGWTRDQRAFDALLAALGDQDVVVRRCAANGLGAFGDKRAIPALEKLAASDQDAGVVQNAREAISRILAAQGPAPPDRGKTRKTEPGGR